MKFLIVTEAYGGHSIEVGREVVCVAGDIFVFFFSFVVRKVRVRAARMIKQVQNRKRYGRGRRGKAPSPIVFFFILGSAFARLYPLLYEPQDKKPTNISPATQATREGTRDLLIFGLFRFCSFVYGYRFSLCFHYFYLSFFIKSSDRVRNSFISLTE